jgi:alpha-methylacyl-CoA racemase
MDNTFPSERGPAPGDRDSGRGQISPASGRGCALRGIRVLDLSRLAPGPFASLVLADLGAEVIKVEEPTYGDWLRYPTAATEGQGAQGATGGETRPNTPAFDLLNRNKKSITLNLKAIEGKAILQHLVRGADVLIEGFRAGTMQRLGLDYESLQPINPGLVYASLSGFGQSGLYRRRACHDVNCLALAGLLDLSGPQDGPPAMSGVPWVDMVAGLWTALGIVAALLERQRNGLGQYLDISMLDSVAALVHVPLADWLSTGVPPHRGTTSLSGKLACYNVYETADGKYMTLGALEPQFWEDFCMAVGHEDWVARQRSRDQAGLRGEVAALFRTQPQAYWINLFASRDCCCEPVLALNEAFAHPQAVQRGLLREGWLATPLASPEVEFAAAPQLGEHTAQILAELGYTLEDVQRLRHDGVV